MSANGESGPRKTEHGTPDRRHAVCPASLNQVALNSGQRIERNKKIKILHRARFAISATKQSVHLVVLDCVLPKFAPIVLQSSAVG